MCISHILDILRKLVGKLSVIKESILSAIILFLPRTRMNLIYGNRLFFMHKLVLLAKPCFILPLKSVKACDNRCCLRSYLTIISVRISLVELPSISCSDKILVHASKLCLIGEQLIYSRLAKSCHLKSFTVPAVKISDYLNTLSRRSPYSKIYTLYSIAFSFMRAHLLVDFIMCPLTEYISVCFS